ncbi:TetR family transcriptional regulator [Streptomyces cyaneofuscatus]|uniref:TetR family transcriptional regulator n=1 Tax=Streptomyces cyaneofuscatus TaxID=66883 RepID=UPI00378F184B
MEKQPERTRQVLVDAAASLIAAGGPADAGLVNICRVAEVSRGALYHHFPSVAQLVGEVYWQARDRVDALACEAFQGERAGAPERFSVGLGMMLEADELVRAGMQVGPDGANGTARLREEVLAGLRERIVAGAPEDVDMRDIADLAVVVTAGLVSLGHTDARWWDSGAAERIWALVRPMFAVAGWLSGPPAPSGRGCCPAEVPETSGGDRSSRG